MSPKLTFELDGEGLPIRLDLFIRHEVSDLSRTEVQRLIRSGAATGLTDEALITPSARVDAGDMRGVRCAWDLILPETRQLPQNLDFGVVYEDEHVIVVDKPAGLAVHAGAGTKDKTLVNGLFAIFP